MSKNKVLPFTYQKSVLPRCRGAEIVLKIFLENSHDVREGRKDENNMKDEYVAYVGTYTHGSSIGFIYMM